MDNENQLVNKVPPLSFTDYKIAVAEFLSSKLENVLVIKGKWGTGKSHLWHNAVKEYQPLMQEDAYSYVSLFGVKDLRDVRERILLTAQYKLASDFRAKIKKRLSTITPKFVLKKIQAAQAIIPDLLRHYAGGPSFSSIAEVLVDNFLICFDDIERRSSELSLKELLGLVDQLNELRGCRIVLIMNDEKFCNADSDAEYKLYREKVVDREIKIEPTSEEATQIVFGDEVYPRISKLFELGGVNNLRVLQRVRTVLRYFEPHLRDADCSVRERLNKQIASIAVIHFLYSEKVSLEQLESATYISAYMEDRKSNKSEILRSLNFVASDFDPIVIEYLRNGLLNVSYIRDVSSRTSQVLKRFEAEEIAEKFFYKAYGELRFTQEEIVGEALQIATNHVRQLSVGRVNALAMFVETYGGPEQAATICHCFIKEALPSIPLTDIQRILRSYDNTTEKLLPAIKTALISRREEIAQRRPIGELLERLGGSTSWCPEELGALDRYSALEFEAFITKSEDSNLRSILKNVVERLVGEDPTLRNSLLGKIEPVLRTLASQSKLNANRLSYVLEAVDGVNSERCTTHERRIPQ